MRQSSPVTITSIAVTPAAGRYGAGSSITFALTPSQSLRVAAGPNGAVPTLSLSDGAVAYYTGQDAGGNLLFGYTVTLGASTPDLAVTGLQLNGATILHPGLSFAAPVAYAAGSGPHGIVVTDVNGDGKPDLITANEGLGGGGYPSFSGYAVSVLPGRGDGSFGAPTSYALGAEPSSVAVADVNKDGKPDLVVAGYGYGNGNAVSVLLDQGNGGFAAPVSYAAGDAPSAVAVADLNGDGKPDLVVTNAVTHPTPQSGAPGTTVSVLLGNGNGGFGAPTIYAAGSGPQSVTVADLNGDGNPDLVVGDGDNTVSVLLGRGNGTFGAPVSYALGSGYRLAAVADVVGNGRPDLIAVNSGTPGSSTVEVLLGRGDGSFAPPITSAVGADIQSVAVADLNGDGKPDLVTTGFGDRESAVVSVLLGNGSGGFAAPVPAATFAAGNFPSSLAVADLNGDGKPDVAVANYLDGTTSVLLNNSTSAAGFDASTVTTAPGSDTGLVITTRITAAPDAASTAPSQRVSGNVLANDSDPNSGATLRVTSVAYAGATYAVSQSGTATVPAAGGRLSMDAAGNWSFQGTQTTTGVGALLFAYGVADSAGATASGQLGIQVTRPVPAAQQSFGFAFTSATVQFLPGQTLLTGPDGTATDVTGVATLQFTDGTIQERGAASGGAALVDPLFYYSRNPDVWRAHVDAGQHYAQFGYKEGRDPDALFSTRAYLAANPDVARAGVDPAQHYDQFGWKEGRAGVPGFSPEEYRAANPDVAQAGVNPLQHYLSFGEGEGRFAFPGLDAKGLVGDFDPQFYLAHNPDVAAAAPAGQAAQSFALQHYLAYGAKEGRDPDALFSTSYYLAHNPDVAQSGVNPLLEFEQTGWKDGRDPGPGFHTAAYLARYADVAAARIDPLQHYLEYGMAEGRQPA